MAIWWPSDGHQMAIRWPSNHMKCMVSRCFKLKFDDQACNLAAFLQLSDTYQLFNGSWIRFDRNRRCSTWCNFGFLVSPEGIHNLRMQQLSIFRPLNWQNIIDDSHEHIWVQLCIWDLNLPWCLDNSRLWKWRAFVSQFFVLVQGKY